jgi:hypothetical protein
MNLLKKLSEYLLKFICKISKTNNMNNHSKRLTVIIFSSFELNSWILNHLHDSEISKQKKILLSVACHDLVIEHQLAISTLIRSKIYGSAFSLVRSVFETFLRGVWIGNCASEEDIKKYVEDKFDKKFDQLLNDVEKISGFEEKTLSKIKEKAWNAMNSCTHGGMQQAARRTSGGYLGPDFKGQEIFKVLKFSNSFALLSFIQIVGDIGRTDLMILGQSKLQEIQSI